MEQNKFLHVVVSCSLKEPFLFLFQSTQNECLYRMECLLSISLIVLNENLVHFSEKMCDKISKILSSEL